ncbi:hypothetical protein DSO57_1026811 [Entomophthora muscae]|uniref:Uncharacterized protein n=1 Tax=Entomophthora muscae TaxID=34485 RepID=A0ACC2UBF1_9FUNG|nr:hypothetical protein DSO57_1026811 [Entomophthora muscae]
MTESQSLASKTVLEVAEAMLCKACAAPEASKIPVGYNILVFKNSVSQSMSKKFLPKWPGPYCMIGQANSGNYYLADQDGHKLNYVINGNLLKLFHCSNEEDLLQILDFASGFNFKAANVRKTNTSVFEPTRPASPDDADKDEVTLAAEEKEHNRDIGPKIIIMDYEAAQYNALVKTFNGKVQGCFFHYQQAINRHLKGKTLLSSLIQQNTAGKCKFLIQKFVALAFI